MSEHPEIVFRPGPTRRRAALAGGPDAREVAHAVKSARSTEPDLADNRLPVLTADNTGTPPRLIRTAARYRAACTEEIDGQPGHHPTRLPRQRKTHALPRIWASSRSSDRHVLVRMTVRSARTADRRGRVGRPGGCSSAELAVGVASCVDSPSSWAMRELVKRDPAQGLIALLHWPSPCFVIT